MVMINFGDKCEACGDPAFRFLDEVSYCMECYNELAHGIIPPGMTDTKPARPIMPKDSLIDVDDETGESRDIGGLKVQENALIDGDLTIYAKLVTRLQNQHDKKVREERLARDAARASQEDERESA